MISMAVVYSATSSLAFRKDTTPLTYLIDQAGFYIIGFAVLLACYRIPMKWYRFLSYAGMAIAVLLLLVPVSHTISAAFPCWEYLSTRQR